MVVVLADGAVFPGLEVSAVGGRLRLPEALTGSRGVVLIYRVGVAFAPRLDVLESAVRRDRSL